MTPALPLAEGHAPGEDAHEPTSSGHDEIRLLRLLSTFFGECPHPAVGDWQRLVEDYPAHQAAIIDFALGYADSGNISQEHLPASWCSSGSSDKTISGRLSD